MKLARQVDTIVIHCSDSPNGRINTAKDIDSWHRQNKWFRKDYFRKRFNPELTSIGYHYVIGVNGAVETGRHPDETGAHVAGHNSTSLGICLIGTDRFTPEQWSALDSLVHQLRADIANGANPISPANIKVIGHYQFPESHKTCPNFDVPAWLANKMIPQAKNVYLAD